MFSEGGYRLLFYLIIKQIKHTIVIQEIVAYCIALKIGLSTSKAIIGFQRAPNPVLLFTNTFVHNTPIAPEIVAGIKFWNAFLIAFKYLF